MNKKLMMGAAALLVAGVAQAAVITWGDAMNVGGDGTDDVSNNGTLIYGATFATGTTTHTVDGVLFQNYSDVVTYSGTVQQLDNPTRQATPAAVTVGTAYDAFFESNTYNAGGSGGVTLNGLTENTEYEVQVFVGDARYGASSTQTIDGSVTLNINTGQYAIGTFTTGAAETDQLITFSGDIVTGLQVRAIPEPATLGLIASFSGAMLFIRRRFMI